MADAQTPIATKARTVSDTVAPRIGHPRRRVETAFGIVSDAIAISLATRLAFILRFPVAVGATTFASHYRGIFLALLGAELVVFWICRMYGKEINDNVTDIVLSCFLGTFLGSAVVTISIFMYQLYGDVPASEISRMVLILRWVIMFLTVSVWRLAFLAVRKNLGYFETRVVLLACSDEDIRVVDEVDKYSRAGHRIIGVVTDNPIVQTRTGAVPILGMTDGLREISRAHRVDEIIVVSENMSKEEAVRTLLKAEQTGAKVRLLPSIYDSLVGTIDIRELAGIPLIEIPTTRASAAYLCLKRSIDIAVASLGLLLTLPVLIAACAAIKLESRGPLLFRQIRVGRGGKTFRIYKLRTMKCHTDEADFLELAGDVDPRITRVGAFLRKRRIDEIPQLLNVLKGDMSLVGPRPPQVGEARRLSAQYPIYEMRFLLRPGLSCLSHTQGRYDSAPEDRLKYDITYLKNLSFFLDFRIMLDTIKVVLTGKGAK